MWSANPITAYIVLGLGNLLGGVTKGVTGFGSAILNLCTWIICVVAGVQSGTLQQAVMCEALSSTLIAPGLLYVTRAHVTADVRMVVAISIFVALSSPLGAAILAELDAKRVELVMAAALALIILAEQMSKLLHRHKLSKCGSAQRCSSCNAADPQLQEALLTTSQQHSLQDSQEAKSSSSSSGDCVVFCAALPHAGGVSGQVHHSSASCCRGSGVSDCHRSHQVCNMPQGQEALPAANTSAGAQLAAAAASDCTVCLVDSTPEGDGKTHSVIQQQDSMSADIPDVQQQQDSQAGLHTYAGPDTAAAAGKGAVCTYISPEGKGHTQQPLLPVSSTDSLTAAADLQSSSSTGSASSSSAAIAASENSTANNSSSSSRGRCHSVRAWLVVLGIGSVAGTLSGIMEGLTGMNGPPIMFMYRRLNTPKATVRGNNAWLNLLQMRLVPYWYMGLIVAQDMELYAVACGAGVVGVWLGDRLSHFINQQAFQQVLGLLMVLCCCLMFASGLGIIA